MAGPALLEARGLGKSFGPTRALDDVSFAVHAGEVHALAGENGAGKSTLIKILAGVHPAFDGQLLRRGIPCRFRGPLDAVRAGIATIHQELSLVGPMSVADNLVLGQRDRSLAAARRALAALELDLDPRTPVEELPLATRQLVEVARALGRDAEVLVMDEPTSALDEVAASALTAAVARLAAQGKGVVYISHRLEEVIALADRTTVLRDGRAVGTQVAGALSRERLVAWMVGREAGPTRAPRARPPGELLFEATGVQARGMAHPVSFAVRRGEIVGLAGLEGAGRRELLEGLYGSAGRAAGRASLGGAPFVIESPARSLAQGVALVPGDRQTAGLVPDLTVVENVTLASLRALSPGGWTRPARERAAALPLLAELRAKAAPDAPVRALSGGNQQKVCLARAALTGARLFLLDDPTRGVDVGAKADIHARMAGWADAGAGLVFAPSEMEELLALSDRVLVLHRGAVVADLDRADASPERVLALAMGPGSSPR